MLPNSQDSSTGERIYSCHPVLDFKVGKFHFKNSRLTLSGADVVEFEDILSQMGAATRQMIRTVSLEMAEQIAANLLKNSSATQGSATSETMRAASQIARDADEALRKANNFDIMDDPAAQAAALADAQKKLESAAAAKAAATLGFKLKG